MTTTVRAALTICGLASIAAITSGQGPSAPPRQRGPERRVIAAERHDVSPRLRDIPPVPPATVRHPGEREPGPRHRGRGPRGRRVDTVVQDSVIGLGMPSPSESFEGVGNVNGVLPPDTNGDVGPNHYVQWVNLSFAIYSNGSPPALIYGPAAGNTLWSGFGGPCETSNDGDPIVLYDHLADRWVMTQLAVPNNFFGILIFAPFYECIAVSATPDPTGAYYRYQFQFDKLNDYPKFGVWPDGYYMTMNQFEEVTLQWAGQGVVAFDRASMLAGQPATMVYFDLAPVDINLGGMLPGDLDGPPPPAGSPNYFVQLDDDAWGYSPDQLQIWQFHADWANPLASTFTGPTALLTEPFDSDMCGYARNCIPQPGTTVKVDALADRLMYRLQYRNFGDHESLVVNHTVDADGNDHAGIRWYEIRDPRTAPAIYQQGTYAPDADHRWVGSAAMDRAGNLAIGFSVSGTATSPSIRYAGRLATDPPGALAQGETDVMVGSGSQTDSSGRWGDYSMMAVDPSDDCTFWYTQEYYAATSVAGWKTRIAVFSHPSCEPATDLPRVTVEATDATATEAGLTTGVFTVTHTGGTDAPLTVSYSVGGSATPDSDYSALAGSVTIPAGAATATITVTPIDDAVYEPNETVAVTLASDPAYRVGSPGSAIVTIVSDELPPDLIVSVVSAPATGGADASITVTDTTRNQGTGVSDPSVTGFYLSTNTSLDAADVFLGGRPVPTLGAGASDSASTALNIPAGTVTGTYYVLAKADVNGVVSESQEGNNTNISSTVRIGPDLIVKVLTAPATAAAGEPMTVSDTTSNQGGGTAAASTTRFYLSANTLLDASDALVGGRPVPSLAPVATDQSSSSLVVPSTTAPGIYYLLAKADGEDIVTETLESNNVKTSSTIKIGADLTVSALTAPATAGAGATISVSDTTKNQGAAPAPESTTTFHLSANVLLDASDVLLGGRPVPSLAAGATDAASTPLQIPAATAAGTYYLLAKADGNNAVAESVETNNASSAVAVRVGPDLMMSALTAPASAAAGGSILVTDTTKNQGAGDASESTTTFHLSTNALLDAADVSLGGRPAPALAAGATHTASTLLSIPAGTTSGTYYLLAKADGNSAVAESIETNNVSFGVAVRIGADLTVSALTAPATAAAGATVLLTDTTKNQGAGPATESTTTFHLSTNVLLDASDVSLGGRSVPALAAGTTNTASTSLLIPSGTTSGTYYLFAKADGNNAVAESIETNNASSAVAVRIGPDLMMSAFTAPSTAGAGGTIAVSDTTKNQGAGAASGSTTMFYLSGNALLDASDVSLGGRPVPPLASGATDAASTSLLIPTGTTSGTYYALAKADGNSAVAESIETNNVSSAVIVRIGPDLVVSALTAPGSAVAGATINAANTTTNQGGGAAAASTTKFYLSTNSTFDSGDVWLGSRGVAALAGGLADAATTALTIPAGTAPGNYYIIAVADGDSAVAETLETNNTRSSFIQISAP
jgi:subtilase family serine protease